MNSKFLKLAILCNDDFGLLLATEEFRRKKIIVSSKFNFEQHDSSRCKLDFRFEKVDLLRLSNALGIPKHMRTTQGLKFQGIEGSWLVTTFLL